ncbi:hypothetical protein Bca52824_011204 [Brassica carinata]|uniref:GRF-type domain-containing protein n=1 Tax=Brassica carinata TaxID=52824 RepID=A0A8X7WEW0_BRACI|nr:hypothetical protein Bca52824_011204 [Brassica carinata]
MGEREMDFRGSRHKGKGKAKESIVLCDCGLPTKKAQSWTDENPFRRFYGCERYKTPLDCRFFQWIDEGSPYGWQKRALLEARNNIRQKEETIMELKKNIAKFQSDWAENAEFEEDIINGFLKL